jgi:TusA-related sulfurtransferase
MDKIYNTVFEVSLRLLLLLATDSKAINTVERIAAIDLITLNARNFGMAEYNLHGDGDFRFGEFSLRREMVKKALQELVINGKVTIKNTNIGFCYEINEWGNECCAELDTEYADEYYVILKKVILACQNKTERELLSLINKQPIISYQG